MQNKQTHQTTQQRSWFGFWRGVRAAIHPLNRSPLHLLKPRRGQAMVEMALVLTILLLLILGGIDGLQVLMTQYTVNQAVRASAHQAALIGGPDGSNGSLQASGTHATGTVADTARTILNSGMTTSADNATITVMCVRNPCRRYDPITVRITYQDAVWAPIGPFTLVKADFRATRLAEKDRQ